MPARHDTERAVRVELHGDRFLPHLLHQFPHGPNVGAIMSELGPSHNATSFGSASSDRSRMAISSPVAVRLFAIARSFNCAFQSAERRMSICVFDFIGSPSHLAIITLMAPVYLRDLL